MLKGCGAPAVPQMLRRKRERKEAGGSDGCSAVVDPGELVFVRKNNVLLHNAPSWRKMFEK